MYADRTTRALLTLLGVALLAAGTAGILAGTGVFGPELGGRYLTDNPIARYLGDNGVWFWPVAALVCAIVALLALRWLTAVLTPRPRVGDIAIGAERAAGPTALNADALADAVTAEINSYRGVDTSQAKVYGTRADPRLTITVRSDDDADVVALRHRVQQQAFVHVRQALDRPDLPIVLNLTIGNRQSGRVL